MSIISNIIDSDLRGFKVNDEIVVDKNVIGEFIKNSAKLTILNKNHQYDSLEKTYLNITNFGKWYVDNLNNNEESVEADLTLFDLSIKFDEDYDDNFTFPATLGEWANWIGNKVGVPLKGTFLNYDKTLKEKPYLGNKPKYRTAVKIIAKYASGWAEINEDETYSIRWFDNTTINIEDWENFKHGSITDPVNIIILSTGVTEDNIRYPEQIPTNAHELRIEDDWLAIDRYLISKSIFEQVNGFSYTAIAELTLPYGLLEFKVGQKIKTKDIELNEIESYISSHILTWDGGDWNDPNSWTSTLKMDELKETTTKYQYSNSIESRVGKTEINCDKNNKRINMLVEDVDEIEQDITTSKQAQGNPIEVNDAGEYPFESIGIDGKSNQETRSGKNLLSFNGLTSQTINGLTITNNKDGSITFNGTTTDVVSLRISDVKNNLKAGTYSFRRNTTGSVSEAYTTQLYGNNETPVIIGSIIGESHYLITPTVDYNEYYLWFYAKTGITFTNYTLKPQLEEGNESTDWELYGASPSPRYPSKIKTVQGVTNKYDKNNITNGFLNTSTGNIDSTSDWVSGWAITDYIEINESTFSLSFDLIENSVSTTWNIKFGYYDKNKNYISGVEEQLPASKVYNLPSNIKYIRFNYVIVTYIRFVKIEEGPIIHNYVPKGRWLEQITIGTNKFNPSTIVNNYTLDSKGLLFAENGSMVSDYIEVKPNTKYTYSCFAGTLQGFKICEYDKNKNFVIRQVASNSNADNTITTKPNTRYIKVAKGQYSSTDKLQLNEGLKLNEYNEYQENLALIDMNKDELFDKQKVELGNSWNNAKNTKRATLVIEYPANQTYTIECNDFSNLNNVSIVETDNRANNLFAKAYTTGEFKFTHKMHPNAKYLCIQFQSDNDFTQEMINNLKVKLYEGYDPYYEFGEVNNAKDEFLDSELTKNVEKLILSSSDNWVNDGRRYYTTAYNNLMITPPNNATKAQALCSINIISATDTFEQKSGLAIHPNGSIYISNDVKTLLDNGDKIVLYIVLKEPKTYQLNYEPLKLHKGYNYITLNDDLYPNMNIKYLTDSKMNADLVSRSEWTMESNRINSEINKKVSNTELDEVIEEQTNKIEQQITDTTNSINLSVTQKINDIQIGGTNLLIGSQLLDNSNIVAKVNTKINDYKDFTSASGNQESSSTHRDILRWSNLELQPNKEYTLSFYAKGTRVHTFLYPNAVTGGRTSQGQNANANDGMVVFYLTNEWKRYWVTYKTSSSISGVKNALFRVLAGFQASVCGAKLEEGNKSSNWSPAPEDKMDNSKFNKAEIVAEINNGVSNVKIYAENIQLANFVISGGKLTSQVISNYDFTQNDYNTAFNLAKKTSWTTAELNKYDLNKDGKITMYDCTLIYRLVQSGVTKNKPGKFEINTIQDDIGHKDIIYGYDGDGNERVAIGLGQTHLTNLNVDGNVTVNGNGQVNTYSLKSEYINAKQVATEGEVQCNDLYVTNTATIDGDVNTLGNFYSNNQRVIVTGGETPNQRIKQLQFYTTSPYSSSPYLEITTESESWGINAWASDKRLKRRVKDSKYNALDTLRKIKHRQFIQRKTNEKVLIGYVADELQELDPNMIFEVGPQKIKQPNPSIIIPILSKAIQEQQEIIDKQDKRITELENQVKKLLKLVEGKKEI